MNFRNTKQKKIIMEVLRACDHPTAGEVYEAVKAEHPAISRGTVFRVLSQFAEDGKVQKLGFPDCPSLFDARVSPHAHARCKRCGKIFDVFGAETNGLFGADMPDGFTVHSVNVEFAGVCKNCQVKENNITS